MKKLCNPKLFIKLKTLEDVNLYMNTIKDVEYNIDLKRGRYIIDGKSLLCVINMMNNGNPIGVCIDDDYVEDFKERCSNFIA